MLQRMQARFQLFSGLLLGLDLAGMKAVFFTGAKTLVVGILAYSFHFFDGQWLDLFYFYFFNLDRRQFLFPGWRLWLRLFFLRLLADYIKCLLIKTWHKPALKISITGNADNLAINIFFGHGLHHFLATLAAQDYFTCIGHTAGNSQNFFLRGF